MKNRSGWFICFYFILTAFLAYQLIFVLLESQNSDLKELYKNGFVVADYPLRFNSSNYFCVFNLPIIGLVISCCGFLMAIFSYNIFLKKNPQLNFCCLLIGFIVLMIGFFINFVGQLFYNQWNNSTVFIRVNSKPETLVRAITFYKYWIGSSLLWSIFGLYFAFAIGCVILMIKLYFINIQTYHFYRQREVVEEFEPELKQPLPSSLEFDPNETQTITIVLDDDNFHEKDKKGRSKKKYKK